MKKNFKSYKKLFIDYIENFVSFIDVLHTTDGTYFLSIAEWDGGDILENGLEDDETVKFDNPPTVDAFIEGVFKDLVDAGYDEDNQFSYPEISYRDYFRSKFVL